MAVTTTVNSNWEKITGKTLSRQSVLTSKTKEVIVCVAIGMCAYPMCNAGYTVDLSAEGRITTILQAVPENLEVSNTLLVSQYVPAACDAAATGTLHFYEAVACAASAPLSELPACATDAQCSTIKFHVTGF